MTRSSAKKMSYEEHNCLFASGASYFVRSFETPTTLLMPASFCCLTCCFAALWPSPENKKDALMYVVQKESIAVDLWHED